MSLVALLCIYSSISTSFLRYGFHACIQNYKWGLTIALYRGIIKLFSLCVIFLRIISRTWLPLDAAILHCSDTFMLAFIVTPKSFSFTVLLRIVPHMGIKLWLCTGQMNSQLSYVQCSKNDHILTIVQRFMDGAHMCLHILGIIVQTLLFANTQLDCNKAKCMKNGERCYEDSFFT